MVEIGFIILDDDKIWWVWWWLCGDLVEGAVADEISPSSIWIP